MTTVCNQSVGPDSVSGSVKSGTKSNVGNCAGFLGSGQRSEQQNNPGLEAGTLGGAVKAGTGMPKSSAGVLTSIEKPLKAGS